MRKAVMVGILLLAGCQNVVGPLEYRQPLRVDDPAVSIEEQHRRARDRLALPDDPDPLAATSQVLPRSMVTGVH